MNKTEQQLRLSATENISNAENSVCGAIVRLREDHGHVYGASEELDVLQRIRAELATIRMTIITKA